MPWGAAIAAVAALGAASAQKDAAGSAAAKQRGAEAAALEGYKQYNQPYYDVGTAALRQIQRLNAGDFSSFQQSPDYQFTLGQGLEAINRAAASRGALNAGGTDIDLMRYGQGLASQQYGDYYSRLAQLAGLGQSSAQGLGGSASQAAANMGQIGANQSINQANAYSNALSQLGALGGQYYSGRQSTYAQPGPVTRQPIYQQPAQVNVPNIPVQGRIYG